MHAVELAGKNLDKRIFLLQGDDLYWTDYALNHFYSMVPAEESAVNIKVFDKLENLDDIIYTLSSFSFTDETQVITVSDSAYNASKTELGALREVMGTDISPYILIFVNVTFLTAAEKKLCETVDCGRLDRFKLADFIEKTAGSIERSAISKLIDYTSQDMSKISLELKKLDAYADGARITAQMVDDLAAVDTELKIYEFVNSASAGNKKAAIKQLDILLKKGEKKGVLLTALLKQYRRLLHGAISPLSDRDLAEKLGAKEYAIKKSRELRFSNKVELKRKLDLMVNYEYKARSGQMTENLAFDTAVAMLLE